MDISDEEIFHKLCDVCEDLCGLAQVPGYPQSEQTEIVHERMYDTLSELRSACNVTYPTSKVGEGLTEDLTQGKATYSGQEVLEVCRVRTFKTLYSED